MAKQTSNFPITSFSNSWERNPNDRKPQSGEQVRQFLGAQNNKKVGAWAVVENVLYAFKDTSDKEAFINTMDASYILDGFDPVTLGSGSSATVDFRININHSGTMFVNGSNPFYVQVNIKSTITEDEEETPFSTDAHLEILVTLNGQITTYGIGRIATNQNVSVNITPYVADGAVVRFRAYDDAGYSRTTSASWNVVRAIMQVATRNNTWWATAYVKGSSWFVPLSLNTNISASLHATLIDASGTTRSTFSTSTFTNNFDLSLPHPSDNGGANGVYTLKIELSSVDASLALDTQIIETKVFCVTNDDTSNYFLVNDELPKLGNYKSNQVFLYAVRVGYGNPSISISASVEGQQVATTGAMDVANGNVYTYILALQQERLDDADFNASVVAKINDATMFSKNYAVSNTEGYAATSGANFLLRFDGRNNSESTKGVFTNMITKQTFTPTITGVNFSSADGYHTETLADGSLQTCFRIQAGGQLVLPITPFAMRANEGRSLEVDYRCSNVLNPDALIIHCFENETNEESGEVVSWSGLKVTSDNVSILAPSAQTYDDQNAGTDDEERMRLTVVVRPLTSGNATEDTFSAIQIYLNGCLQKEFKYGKDLNISSQLTIGSSAADVDLFAVRTYPNALTKQEVERNACNFQASEAEKLAYKQRNNIRENGSVNYNLCRSLFNVIIFECDTLPARTWTKDGKTSAKITFYHVNEAEAQYVHEVTDFTWQGTTSHNYSTEEGVGQNYKWSKSGRKYCAKANWASSMQSHKIGMTAAYTDLAIKCGIINEGTRISILQEPAVGFHLKDGVYTFIGLYTVGNDKGDTTLFGFNKATDFALEGKDNEPLGTNFLLPWNDDVVTVDASNETYSQCGIKTWEDSLKNPTAVTARWKPAYNFVYSCHQKIEPYDGTLDELQADTDVDKENGTHYWLTSTNELYYYNTTSEMWKDTGINLYDTLIGKGYDVTQTHFTNASTYNDKNELYKLARRTRFKMEMAGYFDKKDAFYHQGFIEFHAATDNLSKNTYPYLKDYERSSSRIKWRQDDLDSCFMTENQGKAYKKYCVEFMDNYSSYGRNSMMVWNGTQNQFWALMRECFADEYYAFMRDEFIPATHYGQAGTSEKMFRQYCEHYFFDNAQNHFSEALYNETSKVRYEASSLEAGYQYANIALSQNCGSSYYAEKKWLAMRYIYMCSKYTADNFKGSSVTDVFTTRPYEPEDSAGNTYIITPAIYMYPSVQSGQSVVRGGRIYPGTNDTSVTITIPKTGGDQEQRINGMSYIRSIEQMYKLAIRGNVNVNGRMLTELSLGSTDDTTNIRSKITGIDVGSASSLRKVVLANLTTLAGVNDFSSCVNLRELYADNTKVTSVPLCEGGALQKLHLPATITSLTLKGKKSVTDLQIAGGDNLISIDVGQCNDHVIGKTMDVLTSIYS